MTDSVNTTPTQRRVPGFGEVALCVWDYGGDGPPLFLCHCNGAAGRLWEPVVQRLEGRFRVFAIDHRGHGESGKPGKPGDYAWQHSARDVLAAVDAIAPGIRPFAAGHSSGASYIAEAEILRPGTFDRLLLLDPIIGTRFQPKRDAKQATTAHRRKSTFPNREEARAHFASKPPMNRWCPEVLDAYVAHVLADRRNGEVTLKCPGVIEAWVYEGGGQPELVERLPEIACPVLVIKGNDPFIGPAVEEAAALLPHHRLRTIPGASHFLPQEKPEEVATWLRRWFREVATHEEPE